jgi:predicted AlkP superfamily phosphohydrolase/phosphomutase
VTNGARPARLAVLGFDALDPEVLDQLMAEGRCPNFARVLATGASRPTENPAGVFVGAVWPTVYTGQHVTTHRHHCWAEVDDRYEVVSVDDDALGNEPFWLELDGRGLRVAVLDVPHAPSTPAGFGGVSVSQWGTHDRDRAPACHPAALLHDAGFDPDHHPVADLLPAGHAWPSAPCDHAVRSGSRRDAAEDAVLLDAVLAALDAKATLVSTVLDRGGWDLFIAVFGEAHCAGHQLWHQHDPAHPWHTAGAVDGLASVYERLDAHLGALLEQLGPDAPAFVVLSHGMGPARGADHLLDPLLHRLAVTGPRSTSHRAVAGAVRHGLPAGLRSRLLRARTPSVPLAPDDLPPRRDRPWFAVPNGFDTGAVRLNVRGRDPHGILAQLDVPSVLDSLERDLRDLIDVDTGRPAVTRTWRTDEAHVRRSGDRLPDLLVEWAGRDTIGRVWSPRVGGVAVPYPLWRAGDHSAPGLVTVVGGGMAPGRRPEAVAAEDLAPTICAALDVELPGADGRPDPTLVPTLAPIAPA